MARALTLLNAHIQFLDIHLALIHIPLPLYPIFLQPILQLLSYAGVEGEDERGIPRKPWSYLFPFVNVSITPMECSIVCPRHLVRELFTPITEKLDAASRASVSISKDDFVVIQVGGQGMEAGQRVLDLTAPLALAGISIFFITSYYSDFILVPQKARHTVIQALEEQGFAFSPQLNPHSWNMTNTASLQAQHSRNRSSASLSPTEVPHPPGTPPPATVAEWQTKTFTTLRRHNIIPRVDRRLNLVSCAGYRGDRNKQLQLLHGITRCLLTAPRFLSLTLTESDTASLTLERTLLAHFAPEVLLMNEDTVVPIMLDLHGLPDENAGIICGVAGRLIEHMKGSVSQGSFGMSYLSTAKAGNVIVLDDEVEDALEALRELGGEM